VELLSRFRLAPRLGGRQHPLQRSLAALYRTCFGVGVLVLLIGI
jgi:hypothetical protein